MRLKYHKMQINCDRVAACEGTTEALFSASFDEVAQSRLGQSSDNRMGVTRRQSGGPGGTHSGSEGAEQQGRGERPDAW